MGVINDTCEAILSLCKKPNRSMIPTYYDAIFRCESFQDLHKKGWNYFITEKFDVRMKNKNNKICPLCVLGETNKGKTFLINILVGINLKAGIEHKTEGISCIFSDFNCSYNKENKNDKKYTKKNKFLVFDTAGRSEPLLTNKITEEERENLKKIVDANYLDLKISEEFLKNLLINNSQIILVVVNQLSLAEQIFLYQLKNQGNFDQLFIIHNLFNFENRKDLEDYIDNTIVRSIYFDITKNYYQQEGNENPKSKDRPYYFVEKQDNNGLKSLIAHFILGNIETKDPWIRNFNNRTLQLIKEIMQTCAANSHYKIKEILEKELIEENKIDKEITLREDSKYVIEEKDKPKNYPPNYFKRIGNLKLDKEDSKNENTKKDDTGGIGFNNVDGYIPDYVIYKNNDDTEFVIEVECAGEEDKNISIKAKQSKGKVYFNITGEKIYPKELNLKNKPFAINFSINIGKQNITMEAKKDINLSKPIYEKGIYKKIFKMKKINSDGGGLHKDDHINKGTPDE